MWKFTSIFIGLVAVLALFMAAPALAQETSPEIQEGLCAGVNLDVNSNCSNLDEGGGLGRFNAIIKRIINLLSVIVGVVAVIMIIIGGLRYITSGGSDTSVTG